jgi:8-hydroxy-5-deazaflavin:NADPH oxidoreductase
MHIAILGGTGPQGKGLGYRFVLAGHEVGLGSRDAGRAHDAAGELQPRLDAPDRLQGGTNAEVVTDADIVILSVPYEGQLDLLASLAEPLSGKLLVSCVNPIGFDARGPYALSVAEGSAAEQAAKALPDTTVVAAFHHLSAPGLLAEGDVHDESVLVCGDDAEAKATVIELAGASAGRGGVDAGPLRNAQQIEAMTAVLIAINKAYKARSGIAIAGL